MFVSIILLTFTGDLSLKHETKIHQIINGVFAASPALTLLIALQFEVVFLTDHN